MSNQPNEAHRKAAEEIAREYQFAHPGFVVSAIAAILARNFPPATEPATAGTQERNENAAWLIAEVISERCLKVSDAMKSKIAGQALNILNHHARPPAAQDANLRDLAEAATNAGHFYELNMRDGDFERLSKTMTALDRELDLSAPSSVDAKCPGAAKAKGEDGR